MQGDTFYQPFRTGVMRLMHRSSITQRTGVKEITFSFFNFIKVLFYRQADVFLKDDESWFLGDREDFRS